VTGPIVHSGGLVTPLGLTAPSSCAALRAGLQRFGELRFLDEAGEWLRGAEIELTDTIAADDKLGLCLAMAVEESLGDELAGSTSEVPLLVCTAEPGRPGRWLGLGEGLLEDVQARIGLRFHKASRAFARGRVGALEALREAAGLLSRGTRYVLVAGCDSYLSGATLQSMERRRRLLTSVHTDGFIPGEAAAAVMVARTWLPGRPAVRLAGLGAGEEPAPVESGEPLRADGLVAALRAALAAAGVNLAEVDYRLIGANGESYFFREASLAQARLMRRRRETPADVRGWAAWSGALLGNSDAAEALAVTAEVNGPRSDAMAATAARSMAPECRIAWLGSLRRIGRTRLAAVVVGATGDPGDVPWLLEVMGDPRTARAAGEAFSNITGADLALLDLEGSEPEGFEEGPTDDPSDEDVAIPSDSALPWPDPGAIARWWRAHAGEFSAGCRCLAGAPISREGLHRALREAKQRQRLAAAEELKILTRAGPLFECRSKASPSRRPAP
jgi:3-oxoacyl-[acyl-carrier-protein] synthase-1